MLDMSNSAKVKVTCIVNPHEFYFKIFEENGAKVHDGNRMKVGDIERKVRVHYSNVADPRNIKIGEIYGCFNSNRNQWVRVRVVSRLPNNKCRVFLIDYGIFLEFERLVEIPRELKIPFDRIQRGSLPLKSDSKQQQWSQETLAICKELHSQRDKVTFNFVPICKENGGVNIGDLFVFERRERFSVTERLLANGCVSKCTDPSEIFRILQEECTVPERCMHPKPRIELHQGSLCRDKKVMIEGENLRAPWKSAADTHFSHVFKDAVFKKFTTMTRVQSFVWPQIDAGSSAIIVSKNHDDLISSYLVPLLGVITSDPNYKKKPEHMGPIAIIYTSSIAAVEEIARLSKDLARDLNIVQVAGISPERRKFELISGCDLLIATPPALARLTANISISMLDENRLKHIIYDNFCELSSRFEQHISKSLQQFLDYSQRPQIIATSESLTNALKLKLMNRLPPAERVLCVDDSHIEAASCAGMTLSIETFSKCDDIPEILSKECTEIDKEKTVIIASDDGIISYVENQLSLEGKVKLLICKRGDEKIVKQWDEDDSKDTILLISDSVLEKSDISSARNLIHLDVPTDWRKFSRRFQVFRNAITIKLRKRESASSLTTKILIQDEDIDQFARLLDFVSSQNLSNSCKGMLERIQMSRENAKCEQNVSLCNRLLRLGKCVKLSCPGRHVLDDQDGPMSHLPPPRSQIKFDLISVQTPTSFIVKITEHFGNNKWVSRDETNKFIQQRLNEMQIFCQENENPLTKNEGVVGGVYAKFDDKLKSWVRARIIERVSPQIVKVYLLDFGITVPSIETKLQKLPQTFYEVDPLVCKLQILDLVPLDMENSYDETDTNQLREMIRKVHKSAFYVCKVEALLSDMVFAKSFESRCKIHSFRFNLQNAHASLKISDAKESIELRKLLSSIVEEEPSSVAEVRPTQEIILKEEAKENASITWKQLACGKTYSINISHYISPNSFLITQTNNENLTLKSLLKGIEETQATDRLTKFDSGTVCFYSSDKTYRALILSSTDEETEILLVDYGEVKKCSRDSLFKISSNHLTLCFQTIHCSMMGVRPRFNMKVWPKLQREAVEKLLTGRDLEMLAINNGTRKTQLIECGVNHYEVLLFDKTSKERMDKVAVETRIADEDSAVSELKFELEPQESNGGDVQEERLIEDDDMHSVHIGKDLEELLMRDLKYERVESIETTTSSSVSSTSVVVSPQSPTPPPPSLVESIYKLPQIEWRQNDFMIYLLVAACDSEDYALSIGEFSLDVIIKYANEKFERALIELFGIVDVELCSHERAGSNIIVRIAKKRSGMWPRLTDDSEKFWHIRFSNERVPLGLPRGRVLTQIANCSKAGVARPAGDSDSEEMDNEKKLMTVLSDDEDEF